MKFIKNSFGYIFKNFLYIFLLSIIPSAFIGGLISPFKTFEFMTNYSTTKVSGFGDIFYSLVNFNWLSILFTLLACVVLAIFVSLTVGQMENHMRSGKLNYKGMSQYLNNNILVIVANIVIWLLIWFVLQLLLSGMIMLNHIIFSGLGTFPNAITIVFAIILCVLKFVLMVQISGVIILTVPNMLISGYPIKQAISNAIKLLNKQNFNFLFAVSVPFVVIIPLACVLKGGLTYLTNVLGVMLLFIYLTSLSMTSYFELSSISRYDNRKYYNYKS